MTYIHRFLKDLPISYFLLGPRGTGKTVWLEHTNKTKIFLDLLQTKTFFEYFSRPEKLYELVKGTLSTDEKKQHTFIIDEVQKVPQLLDLVHRLIYEHPNVKFILTGSSARKLKRADTNLLGGRAAIRSMHPYMAAELGNYFNFEKALQYGMLPVVWHSKMPEETLKGYVGAYLIEEVKNEGIVRKLDAFSRFLEAASFSHSSILNQANIGRECACNAVTTKGFFEVLNDLLICFFLTVFSKHAKRDVIVHPKFYFFDAGVFRTLRPLGPLDRGSEIDGHALEGLVGQHLRAWCDYSQGTHKLHFWRTRNGLEVDFIIYGESGLYAIEIKNSDRIREEDLKGLKAFQEDYPVAQLYLLYRGKEILKKGNTLCFPCEPFLRALIPNSWPFKNGK